MMKVKYFQINVQVRVVESTDFVPNGFTICMNQENSMILTACSKIVKLMLIYFKNSHRAHRSCDQSTEDAYSS
jgi:hypothetical protein